MIHKAFALSGALLSLSPLLLLRQRRYEQFFRSRSGQGAFRGVFESFDEARRSAPSPEEVGFDRDAFAQDYEERTQRVYSYDYPVLFWLRELLGPDAKIFDLGGHIGVQFYAYRKYLDYPPGLRWRVCEVETVVNRGRERAAAAGESALEFTTQAQEMDGSDILICAGALQYIENFSLAALLTKASRPPAHLLLNKLPIWDGPRFVTLQNAGTTFVPQYVFNRAELLGELQAAGYAVVDRWDDYRHSCRLPFEKESRVEAYSGLYLRRK